MKIERKIMSTVIAAAILLTSIPTMVFAEGEDIDTPNTPVETSIQTSIEEQPAETTVEETVDENTKTIPSDETEPTTETVEDIEEPPIEETTIESSETEKPTETTETIVTETTQETQVTESSETTVESTEPSETTTETTVTETSKIIIAKSYDEYFELISKLPDAERIIVDTEEDLSMLTVKAGVYFDGTYILAFENATEKAVAVNTLVNLGISYSLDGEFNTCDNDDEWTFYGIGEDDDTLPDDWEYEDTETVVEYEDKQINPNAKTKIAIIDTGSNKANEAYSIIGDSVADDNGHGTLMSNLVLNGSDDAYIVSIKALDKDGHGQVADVYAAIQLAESMNVDYILLAISIRDNGKYTAFKELITNCKAKVITAAGNNGTDAKKYLPANIEKAYVVGAIDYETTIMYFSNYGSTVDYYMNAESTSEASAIAAGLMISGETELNAFADIDGEHYYYEGSEYEFETDTIASTKYYYAADAVRTGKTESDLRTLALNYAKGQNKKNQANGCIDLAMHAVNYAVKGTATPNPAFKSDILNSSKVQVGKQFDFSSAGCTTFMQSRAGISASAKVGVYNLTGSGAGQKYINANIKNGKALYNYCKNYAKPGDIIFFSNGNNWVHAAVYAGTVTGSKSEMYGGSYQPGIVIWEAPGVGKAVRKRIISAADFAIKDAEKQFTKAVVIKPMYDQIPAAELKLVKTIPTYCRRAMSGAGTAPIYSYVSTTYGIYTSADCNESSLVFELVSNEQGYSENNFSPIVGTTYYIKEISAGSGLTVDNTIHTFKVTSATAAVLDGETIASTNNVFELNFEDTPLFDPLTIQLRKVDTFGKPVNGATIDGATFIIEYYNQDLGDPNATDDDDTGEFEIDPDTGLPDTGDPLEQGEEDPDQPIDVDTTVEPIVIYRITFSGTVLQTIKLSDLQALTPIGGTDPDFFNDLADNTYNQLPLGTYRIYEETAPDGYNKNEQVLRIILKQDPNDPSKTLPAARYIETETGNSRFWNHTLNGDNLSLVLAEAPEVGYYELTKKISAGNYDVSGFKFELWNKTQNIKIATGISQTNGKVLWTYVAEDYKLNADPNTLLTGTTTEKLELALGPSDARIEYEVREIERTDVKYKAVVPVHFITPTVSGKSVTVGQNYYSIVETFTEKDQTISREFNNTPKAITALKIRKSDTSNDGIARTFTFDIYYLGNGTTASTTINEYVESVSVTTNTAGEGTATIEGLPTGWYKVVEKTNDLKITYPNGQIVDATGYNDTITFDVVNSSTPKIGTTLVDSQTNDHIGIVSTSTKLVDTISYSGLFSGTYKVTGTLYNKATNQPFLINGQKITGTAEFTLEKQVNAYGIEVQQDGTVDVEYTFDSTGLKGISLVAFEELYLGNELIAKHNDINDEGQTVSFPDIHTVLLDTASNKNIALYAVGQDIKLVDTIYYTNLVPNKQYKVSGVLVSRSDNGTVTTYTGSREFTPTTKDGTTTVEFTVPYDAVRGKVLVAYESLSFGNIDIVEDNDINNEAETVYIPEIKTTLVDNATGEHITTAVEKEITLTDTVEYTSLKPGVEYLMTGTLMDKKTGEPLKDKSGNPIYGSTKFTPNTPNGTVDVVFKFTGVNLNNTTIVAFEDLKQDGVTVAIHTNIDDYDQTVFVPDIHTTFYDLAIGEKAVGDGETLTSFSKTAKLVDRVYYENVVPNKEYTLVATVMVKSTGEKLLDANNAPYTVTKTFTPTDKSGYVDVEFEIDTTLIPNTSLVCFETLKFGTVELVIHSDINDVDQTVKIPEIKTTATDKVDGDKLIDGTKKEQTIIDTVKYTNLIIDKEYTITGKLVVKKDYKDGEELEYVKGADGNDLVVSKTFTAESENGSETLEFTFDATKYAGYSVVVFEDLYYNNVKIAMHADIEDTDQTVEIGLLLHVKIAKMDGKNIKYVLKNAEITIYQAQLDANGELVKDEKGNVIYTVVKDINGKDCIGVTDETGIVEFTILWNRNYKYFAKETVAPRGYYLNNDYFEVIPTETRESDGVCLIPIQIYDFIIPPKTGDSMNIGLYVALACVALAVVAGGTVFLLNKKNKNKESDDSK